MTEAVAVFPSPELAFGRRYACDIPAPKQCWICREDGKSGKTMNCGHWELELIVWQRNRLEQGEFPAPSGVQVKQSSALGRLV